MILGPYEIASVMVLLPRHVLRIVDTNCRAVPRKNLRAKVIPCRHVDHFPDVGRVRIAGSGPSGRRGCLFPAFPVRNR